MDFITSNEKSHETHYAEINQQKILTTLAIHGSNASGKSNCILAFLTMANMILNSVFHENLDYFEVKPFQLSYDSDNSPTMFEVFFVEGLYEYQYGFKVDGKHNQIQEEWLYKKRFSKNPTKNNLIFERKDASINTKYSTIELLHGVAGSNILLATLLGARHVKEGDAVFRFFSKIKCSTLKYQNQRYETKVGELLKSRPNIKSQLEKLLKEIDPCIQKLKIQEAKGPYDGKKYRLFGVHKGLQGKTYEFPLLEESEGTAKFIRILPYIFMAFLEGGIIIVDELDNHFHPLVYRKIVSLFYDKNINIKNAQLIYTTHSIFLFNSVNMRRDQLLLVEKDQNGISSLYSLDDFDFLRIDSNYGKKYLSGEFGTIPFKKG